MLTGYYLQLQFDDLNDAFKENMQQYRDQGYPLTNGNILDMPGKKFRKLKFDFNGLDETWDGYIVGYLYPDKKFLGTFHPVKESEAPDTKLSGTYQYTRGIIKISGIEYGHTSKWGYYMELAETSDVPKHDEDISDEIKTYSLVLTADLSHLLSTKAEKIKRKAAIKFDHYQGLIDAELNPVTEKDFLLAASAAYSWMPTMLELFPAKQGRFYSELKAVQELGKIKNVKSFKLKEEEINEWLILLTNTINHSIVGVSKTLHLFYPNHIPILDSRVLKAWQKTFGKHYKKYPSLKLSKTVSYSSNRQVPLYMKYWKLMLQWKENSGVASIRDLEEPLYWLGKG